MPQKKPSKPTKSPKGTNLLSKEHLTLVAKSQKHELQRLQNQKELHRSPKVRGALEDVCTALHNYLTLTGWEPKTDFTGWVDPLTGLIHRTDIAFTLESDRGYALLLEEKLKESLAKTKNALKKCK
jgi:hypothetical protein